MNDEGKKPRPSGQGDATQREPEAAASSSMILKTCKGCGEDFPATAEFFYRCCGTRDGLKAKCKTCVKRERKLNPPWTWHATAKHRISALHIPDKMVPAALALKSAGYSEDQIADDLDVPKYAVTALFRVTA